MRGWSTSSAPNADRWRAWCTARTRAARIVAAEPSTQSSRVAATMSRIVRMPRPSSPTRTPQVPSSSTSDDALDRLPSLSLSRCSAKGLRVPSSRTRGTRKQPTPASVCASTRKASLIGAEQNHLWPVSRYVVAARDGAAGRRARRGSCWPARRSRPASRSCPCPRWRRALLGDGAAAAGRTLREASWGTQRCGEGRRRPRGPAPRHTSSTPGRGGPAPPRDHVDEAGGAAHVGAAAARRGPRLGGEAGADGDLHERVPGGVELDLVEALAAGGVGAQDRLCRRWPGRPSDGPARCPTRAPARRPRSCAAWSAQRRSASSSAAGGASASCVGQRGRLVGHGVGGHGCRVCRDTVTG